jgi:hypothetical protein
MNGIEALRGIDEGPRDLMVSSEKSTEPSSGSAEGTPATAEKTGLEQELTEATEISVASLALVQNLCAWEILTNMSETLMQLETSRMCIERNRLA